MGWVGWVGEEVEGEEVVEVEVEEEECILLGCRRKRFKMPIGICMHLMPCRKSTGVGLLRGGWGDRVVG